MLLSKAETDSLQLTDVTIDRVLFRTMDRLQKIRDESLVLMDICDAEAGSPAANDIRANAAEHLDTAYRKLFRWCSLELRQPLQEGTDVGEVLQQALARLAAREDLLRSALRIFTESRSSLLPNLLVKAIKVGGGPPHYQPRPIEVHAHDAARYVSDILAWVHQALAGERELVTALLSGFRTPQADTEDPSRRRRIGHRHHGIDASVDFASLSTLAREGAGTSPLLYDRLVRYVLDKNMAGCCSPMSTHIVQTLRLQRDCVAALRLYNVIRFYSATMAETIGAKAALSAALLECVDCFSFADVADSLMRL